MITSVENGLQGDMGIRKETNWETLPVVHGGIIMDQTKVRRQWRHGSKSINSRHVLGLNTYIV